MKAYLFPLLLCLVAADVCNIFNRKKKVGEHYANRCTCIDNDTKVFGFDGNKCYCYSLGMILECRAAKCEFDGLKGCHAATK
jgi:hypothetical protein